MTFRAPLILALFALISGCACPPEPELRRYTDADHSSPEMALEYFRKAATRGDALHLYQCFSQEMIQRDGIVISQIEAYFPEVRARIEEQIGNIEDIEIDDAVVDPGTPYLASCVVRSENREERVHLVLETLVFIRFNGDIDNVQYVPPYGTEVVSIQGRELVIRAALDQVLDQAPSLTATNVYVATVERAWRIVGIEGRDLGLRKLVEDIEQRRKKEDGRQ